MLCCHYIKRPILIYISSNVLDSNPIQYCLWSLQHILSDYIENKYWDKYKATKLQIVLHITWYFLIPSYLKITRNWCGAWCVRYWKRKFWFHISPSWIWYKCLVLIVTPGIAKSEFCNNKQKSLWNCSIFPLLINGYSSVESRP